MDGWTFLSTAALLATAAYGISVPVVIAWSVLERRRAADERRARRASDRTLRRARSLGSHDLA